MNTLAAKFFELAGLAALGLALAGCSTRSISNSEYQPRAYETRGAAPRHTNDYQGELNEFEVLGIARDAVVTDADIQQALDRRPRVSLHKGRTVLLIQSGAAFPDAPMVAGLERHFRVVPFTGVPPAPASPSATNAPASYAKALRLAAAQGGAETILCYWGILESASRDLITQKITWIPVVDVVVPDEIQKMRIRLKMAIIDVRTGAWSVFSVAPPESSALSFKHGRESTDQTLVHALKKTAYQKAVKDLIRLYVED